MLDICIVNYKKHILVAPLNWGLGHATRCIPIIRTLLSQEYKVTIASDGQALKLLIKEFPDLATVTLPSYNIEYSEKGSHFKRKLIADLPSIRRTIKEEHRDLEELIYKLNIDGVISDNRLGLYTKKVPCVIISHQLQVLSGKTTWFSSAAHRMYLQRFNECWVPDVADDINLSGILGHPQKKLSIPTKYIGPLSRMQSRKEEIIYDYIAVLSGPEPQRSMLEDIIITLFKKSSSKLLIVQGKVSSEQEFKSIGHHIKVVNYLTSIALEKAINQSSYVIVRSGYTTIMDLAVMRKKVFFIPTPGQTEQEYLAEVLKTKKIAPYCTQDSFKSKELPRLKVYPGFEQGLPAYDLTQFFGLFNGKRELRAHPKFTFNIHSFFMRFNDVLDNRQA